MSLIIAVFWWVWTERHWADKRDGMWPCRWVDIKHQQFCL